MGSTPAQLSPGCAHRRLSNTQCVFSNDTRVMRETMSGIKDVCSIGRAAFRQVRVDGITNVTAIRQAVASACGRIKPGAPIDIRSRGDRARGGNPQIDSLSNSAHREVGRTSVCSSDEAMRRRVSIRRFRPWERCGLTPRTWPPFRVLRWSSKRFSLSCLCFDDHPVLR